MNPAWNILLRQQFGVTIDMLENALVACPDQQWRENVWDTLFGLDLYLSGATREAFEPLVPLVSGKLPEKPYTKDELHVYPNNCGQKCETKFTALTDEKTGKICQFPRSEQVNFTELQLHSMRNGQEHASQLTLHLGRAGRSTLDQVARAGENLQRWP